MIVGWESVPATGRESWTEDVGNAAGVDGSEECHRPTPLTVDVYLMDVYPMVVH